mmetsp:Transcript_10436/g.24491  ORF Transcript_10436/g.24491 Transcript_10436/m.24491 type:complete len:167 (-) Transcript_10436:1319-1819(-)
MLLRKGYKKIKREEHIRLAKKQRRKELTKARLERVAARKNAALGNAVGDDLFTFEPPPEEELPDTSHVMGLPGQLGVTIPPLKQVRALSHLIDVGPDVEYKPAGATTFVEGKRRPLGLQGNRVTMEIATTSAVGAATRQSHLAPLHPGEVAPQPVTPYAAQQHAVP